ncbi:hypothetical protein KBY24_15235 [Ruegeria pomeroyi]|nr:hypothetical protein [Ruegeria pomeroyi]
MERRIVAILAADMVGFSSLIERDEAGTLTRQKRHRLELIEPSVQNHSGRIIKLTGDGLIAEFNSVVEALQAAVLVQREMNTREQDMPDDLRIRYRVAIHLGDVVFDEDDIYGDGVNVASRLEALAEPGGIVVSGIAHDMLKAQVKVSYRSLGEKKLKNISAPVKVYQVTEANAAPRLVKPYGGLAWAGLLVVVFAAALLYVLTRPDFTPVDPDEMALSLPEKPSIAVLPFKSRGEAVAQDWVADAISESIISTLSLSPDMVSIAYATMSGYKGRDVTAAEAAQELGVRYILSGSVLKDGDTLRVTAELSDAIKGQQIWALQEDSAPGNLIALQDTISRKIFEELSVSLTMGETTRSWLELLGGFENYVKVITGRAEFQKFSPEGHANAERIWTELYKKEPERGATNYLMGYLYWQKVAIGISADPASDWAKATEFSERAIEVQENGEVYTLAAVLAQGAGDRDKAIAMANKAVSMSPGSADANSLGGMVKAIAGQTREGLELMERGMRLEPDYPEWLPAPINFARLELGEYDAARKLALEVLASDTKNVQAKPYAAEILTVLAVFEGDMKEARKQAQNLLKIHPRASAASVRKARANYWNREFVDRYIDALVQAGIPES